MPQAKLFFAAKMVSKFVGYSISEIGNICFFWRTFNSMFGYK